jgi:cytochrome c biogenesis protein CcmG, thiol:disulfide interchange protein DsbE
MTPGAQRLQALSIQPMKRSNVRRDHLRLRPLLIFGVIAAIAAGLWLGLRPVGGNETGDDASRGVTESGAAPAFTLPRLIGEGKLSSHDLKGSPYVLNFWATWCDPCRAEMPAFEKVWEKYRRRGVVVVGVNINDDLAAAGDFARGLGITYPLVVDENDELATELGVKGLPQTFFIDGAGEVVSSGARLGLVTEAELTKTIESMLRSGG